MIKEQLKITSGSAAIDWLLEGGYEKGVITTIYGPPGTGKSNLCMICLANNTDKKVIYIDTEGSFSVDRLKQIANDYEEILKNVVVLKPIDFNEQKRVFEKLSSLINTKIGLLIVDSMAMLYRLEIGRSKDAIKVNRELGVQLASLIQIARKFNIPVILTNQVYSDFEDKEKYKLVGGDTLKYASKCLVELQNYGSVRKAVIKKHRSLPENKEIKFKIVEAGIEEVEE